MLQPPEYVLKEKTENIYIFSSFMSDVSQKWRLLSSPPPPPKKKIKHMVVSNVDSSEHIHHLHAEG